MEPLARGPNKGFLVLEAYKIEMDSVFALNLEYTCKTSWIGQDGWNIFFANGLSQYKLNNGGFIEADENAFVSKTQYKIWTIQFFPVPKCTTGNGSLPGVKRLGRDVEHRPHLTPRLKKE